MPDVRADRPRRFTRSQRVVGVLTAALLAGGIVTVAAHGSSSAAPALTGTAFNRFTGPFAEGQASAAPDAPKTLQQWASAAQSDISQFTDSNLYTVKIFEQWQQGVITGPQVLAEVAHVLPFLTTSRAAIDKRAPFAGTSLALADYRETVELYLEAVRVVSLSTYVPAGSLRTQLQLSADRIHTLGDRVYDQAGDTLASLMPPEPASDGVTVVAPVAVPDWSSTSVNLAAGPPLAATPHQDPAQRPGVTRPTQSVAGWKQAVAGAKILTAAAETAAVTGGGQQTLQAQSDAFDAAAASLATTADPKGSLLQATRLRLGLLVDEEATRTAEAALLVPAAQRAAMKTAAETLALVGDDLWDTADLGPRATTFPASLLTQ